MIVDLRSISSSKIKFLNQPDSNGNARSLPHSIDAIMSDLSAKGIGLDKLEARSRDPLRVTRLADLRDYKILEKVLFELKDDDSLSLIKRCFLTCQPELKHDLIWYDPSISDGRRNKICRKYIASETKRKYTETLDVLRKQNTPFDGHQFTLFHNQINMLEKILKGEADEDDFDAEYQLRYVSTQLDTNYTEMVYDAHGNLLIGADAPKIQGSSSTETLASPRSNSSSNGHPMKELPPPVLQGRGKKSTRNRRKASERSTIKRWKRSCNRVGERSRDFDKENVRDSDNKSSTDIQQQQNVSEELPERWKNWQPFYENQRAADNIFNANSHQHPSPESGGGATQRRSTATANNNDYPEAAGDIRTDINHISSMASKLEGAKKVQYVQELMTRHRDEASKSFQGQSLTTSSNSGIRHHQATESSRYYTKHLREYAIITVPPPAREGDPPITTRVRRNIMEGSYPNWSVNEKGLDRILRYAWKGKLKKLKSYLEDKRRHDFINIEDSSGRTALHYGAAWGCIRTIKILMCVPDIQLNIRDEHGKTPLFKAVEMNSIECAEHLINSGANSLIPARDSRDPLTYTLNYYGDERFEMFCFLFHHGGYQDEKLESGKLTLLHKAVLTDREIVVLRCTNYMLQYGQDINAKEADGRSPILIATIMGREDLVGLFLAYEPNVFYYDNKGKTVFDYNENKRINKLLEKYVQFGPGDLDAALRQRDGKAKESIKIAEQFRKHRLGYTPS